MKLQILVPQYKEDETVLKNLLNSIEVQQGIDLKNDIEVIIVNDGTDVHLSKKFFNKYSFPITYHKDEHRGIAGTRNALLNYADADYIMFCDSDDMFASSVAIYSFFNSARQGDFDELVSYFYMESVTPSGDYLYGENQKLIHPFIHGKVFRLQYLRDNNIRFNESVHYHEDVYFSFLAHSCANTIKMLPQYAYLWKYNVGSVTHQPNFSLINYHDSLNVIGLVADELVARGKLEDARFYFACCLFNTFTFAHTPSWLSQVGNEYWLDMCNWVRWLWKDRGELLFNQYNPDALQKIWNDTIETAYKDGALPRDFLKETFNEWFVDILNNNGQNSLTLYPQFANHIEQ